MIDIDTNILVRLLTDDDSAQAEAVRRSCGLYTGATASTDRPNSTY